MEWRKLLSALVIGGCLFGLAPVFAAEPGPRWGMVDYRLLLLAHPLMARYDHGTRRFAETVSGFVIHAEAMIETLNARLKALLEKKKGLEKKAKPLLLKGGDSGAPFSEYGLFWRQKRFLDDEIQVVQDAIASASLQRSYDAGRTSESSMVPMLNTMNDWILEVTRDLRKKHNLRAVLDVSAFTGKNALIRRYTAEQTDIFIPGVNPNLHWELWKGNPVPREAALVWVKKVREGLPRLVPAVTEFPIRAGVADLRQEAFELLRAYAAPSFLAKEEKR
jgi:hypothetical protein